MMSRGYSPSREDVNASTRGQKRLDFSSIGIPHGAVMGGLKPSQNHESGRSGMPPIKRPLPDLDPSTTALVLIDLQRGITSRPTQPRSGDEVVRNAVRLARAARERGALVVLVRVSFAADGGDMLRLDVEETPPMVRAPGWDELVDDLRPLADVVITKRQWGAFYGTGLDLELRRRGRRTIVLGGISTNFGVESTARDAWERAYQLVFVEDAMAAFSTEDHEFAFARIFPRLGRASSTEDILNTWNA
jgi:nicotinamidase-related amidase